MLWLFRGKKIAFKRAGVEVFRSAMTRGGQARGPEDDGIPLWGTVDPFAALGQSLPAA